MGLALVKRLSKCPTSATATTLMLDKANFTSQMSIESPAVIVTSDDNKSAIPIKSALKSPSRAKVACCVVDKTVSTAARGDTNEEAVDKQSKRKSRNYFHHTQTGFYRRDKIEKLGLHQVETNQKTTYNGVIYLPECDLVIAHYLTLYRLKLDYLSQKDFENWCLAMGHIETAWKYLKFQQVYSDQKSNHFKESFIINKILSRQNVNLKFSDSFGHEGKQLRALVVIGKRNSAVRSIIDCYFFNVKGKIPFVIKSNEDYNKIMKLPTKTDTVFKFDNEDLDLLSLKNCSHYSRTKLSQVSSARLPFILNESPSKVIEVLNIHPNSINDLRFDENINNLQSNSFYEPFSNYMRYQRYHTDVNSVCYNSPILCNDVTYNLVSIITDKTYAYILCKNSLIDLQPFDEVEVKSLVIDEPSTLFDENQSNSVGHLRSLQKIMKTEICEAFIEKYYGVSLKQVPCGQFYVIQCTIDGQITDRELLVNRILTSHMVCGKVISKEYNLNLKSCGDINFIMHLHGNEKHVFNCCNELKIEGIARNFKLIHPRYGKFAQEVMPMSETSQRNNVTFRDE